ncbi:Hypothetical protein NTJ_11653 [Nesidiocoris tenuis]|uniref:Uncharacterized protein n=1 Tax=Nesidiocoris tenuis TaxID=355587 RepID=A0ABN7B4S2_9HEMI|nr:Hypothetical protein NTJ_11653 [Nesidiocoris tenuis]
MRRSAAHAPTAPANPAPPPPSAVELNQGRFWGSGPGFPALSVSLALPYAPPSRVMSDRRHLPRYFPS